MQCDVAVIGGSFAGLAAALQVARTRRPVVVIDAGAPRNRFAGEAHGFLAQDGRAPGAILADARTQLLRYPSARILNASARRVEKTGLGFLVQTDGGQVEARRLVLATGVTDTLPDLPGLLQAIVLMGGSTDRGNTTAVAEFNIHADPEAAARVFGAGVPLVMFGLNVCRQVLVGEEHVRAVRALGTERAELFADHLDAYVGIARRRGATHMAVYDPTPVAWLARPALFTLEPAHVDVELEGRLTRGMTVCEFRVPARARPNTRVAMAADGPAVMSWALQGLARALA